jgi:hypothetical protein
MTSAAAEAILDAMLQALRDDGDRALCDALDMLAQRTRQNKFRNAASIVRGTKLGRTAIDDRAALRRIAGFAPALHHEAVGIVAQDIAGSGASKTRVDTIAHRLRRKIPKNETDEKVLSASPAS